MEPVFRAAAIYLFLLGLFRVAGRRSLSELSNFEFVLLLIVGEATQQAVLGKDYSLTNAFLVIMTLVALQIIFTVWKQRSTKLKLWMDGTPIILVEHGRPLSDRMHRLRIGEGAIMEAARELSGLERMDQIKYAVLESTGTISIIPRPEA